MLADRPVDNQGIPAVADAAPRVRIVVLRGRGAGAKIDCRRIVTVFGSRKGCKLNLRHSSVSPVHLAIVNTGTEIIAIDLMSKNGTLLNGLRMEHERLSDDDILTVGPWQFQVEIARPERPGKHDLHPLDLELSPPVIALELVSSGRTLHPNRDVCLIGRRSGCDITISDNRISRTHALLLVYFGRPAIVDLFSQNQTQVNELPVRFQILENDDMITIGETKFRVKLVGSAAGEKPTNGRNGVAGGLVMPTPDEISDEINIAEVEGSQRWKIVDSLKKASRNK